MRNSTLNKATMRKLQFGTILFILATASLINSCNSMKNKPLRIALSSATDNYIGYIHRADSNAQLIDLKGLDTDSALMMLASCDGILFTGGEDVVPSYYGKGYDSIRCESNPSRDSLEFQLIKKALSLKIPIFGICRGQQILNVALGGTLIVDIPSDHKGDVVHRSDDYLKCYHEVRVTPKSRLAEISNSIVDSVSSNHHQAIEKLARGLKVTAWSFDSIPEAIEWENPLLKPFFLAVQWHPERMDINSKLSMPLMHAFIEAANEHKNSTK